MSALGQEQTFPDVQAMSALPPKADIDWHHLNVRFVSEGDICSAKRHVRFTPNSDRESGFSQEAMSALPPTADMCSAQADVCLVPKADISNFYSITSSACASSAGGTAMPSALAVLRLITSSYLVGACTGRSAGFSPLRIRST